MKIKKYGHCCLLIEEGGLRILTDPGVFSTEQSEARDLDLILITHEHEDHLHLDSLKEILKNNPQAKVLTNTAVGEIIAKEGIAFEKLEDGQNVKLKDVLIEAYGNDHALIFPEMIPQVQNTGFFIADRFYYPGDALHNPGKSVEILALPVSAPWEKMSEVLTYLKEINPKAAFPVHDGMQKIYGPHHGLPTMLIGDRFHPLLPGDEVKF